MSLLDGLKEAMINPLYNTVMESDADDELDFELALEAAIDKHIVLDQNDIDAIMDDSNPDNIVADMSPNDESPAKIAKDYEEGTLESTTTTSDEDAELTALETEMDALEAMLDELLAMESTEDNAEDYEDPQSMEGCDKKACEEEEASDNDDDEDDEDDEDLSLDSLLNLVFNN